MAKRTTIHDRLAAQPALLGLLQTYPNLVTTEMAAECGYDFVFLDCEHGLFDDKDCFHAIQVSQAHGMAALVRVRGHDLTAIARFADMGADAILVPQVETAVQAQALAKALVYPPAGTRGYAAPGQRATRFGLQAANHLATQRTEIFFGVIIESRLGVENSDAILTVNGVDAVIIGPSDLSADLGQVGDFSAEYEAALHRIERAALDHRKLLGMPPHQGQSIDALQSRGHRLFIVGSDVSLLRDAMTAQLQTARATLAPPVNLKAKEDDR